MLRILRAELLDSLPSDDPDAAASRRDLKLINHLMGNWHWLVRALVRSAPRGSRVLEIGAGCGAFARWWGARQSRLGRDDIRWTGLDQAPRPTGWPAEFGWYQADLRDFTDYGAFDVVISSLTLHHFTAEELKSLGTRLHGTSRPHMLLATEPARHVIHLWQARALALLGVNRVTRHDAPASVAAGFRGAELPTFLGLQQPHWRTSVQETFLGSYRMRAVQTPAVP